YYGSGHLLQTALDGITVSEYERDSLHRQVMRTQGALATFSGYNADNRLSWQRSLPGGSQNPQQAGNPPAQNDSVTARDYIWNADGEVGGINDKLRGCLVFSYDRSGWLTSRTGQMYDHDHYYYDKAGNLLTDEHQSAVMDNRLPGYGRDRYRYNEWGELTERRDQQLEWNAQGQLTRVISSNSETRYQYDALGRRISKATSNLHTDRGERSRTTFVWEGFRLLQETTWQGKRTYLYDAEQPYTPVAVVTGRGESQKIWYYHTDLTGTVQEVTAPDGTLVWAGYQAGFGENRGDISNSGAYFEQPLRLPGQYYDEETGLHYNLFRYYAPECGRFVSQDPIGLNGGLNLYAYAPNPLSWSDPLGLEKCLLSAADKKIMGDAPAGMINPHRHHIGREKAPRNWSKQNRDYITQVHDVLDYFGIDKNKDIRNFTWATNGRGAHTIKAARHVWEKVMDAAPGGVDEVEKALSKLGQEMRRGKFF
ncbi:TPA: RHS repeat-associated core domain-containing protein, partial [Escherichia coli]